MTGTERSMSFGAIAGDYDRLRPGPPPTAVDWLLPAREVVVDLLVGTRRVLRDGGRLGVLSANMDRPIPWLRADEWFARDEDEADSRAPTRTHAQVDTRQVILPDGSPFGNIETRTFRFARTMTVPDLLDWLATYSWVITASDKVKAAGRTRAAVELAEKFPGASEIEEPMRSRCWRTDRVPRSRG